MRDPYPALPTRRRPWLIIVPVALVVVLAAAWTGFWFVAAGQAETQIAAWRAREAKLGRNYTCVSQTIGGFPFRLEVRCGEPSAELRRPQSLAVKAKEALAVVQIYQPNLLISEITGPLTVGEPGSPAMFSADWRLAQTSVRGLMPPPERISAVFDDLTVTRLDAGPAQTIGTAAHLELHLRQAPRLPQDTPALDLALRLTGATAPPVPQLASAPVDADISAILHGLSDYSAKPLAQRLRELQAAGGRLEIKQARVKQGEIVTVGQGTLALNAAGLLNGELRLTVAGLEHLVTALGLDDKIGRQAQGAASRLAPGLNLEKLLGSRGNAMIAAAGVAMLGQPAELEVRKAIMLPLRFTDGTVFLGPLMVGQMQPLF